MQFDGMKPLAERIPTVEVEGSFGSLDLHNDALLRDIAYIVTDRTLRFSWTLKQAAWSATNTPEPVDRPTVASAALIVSGVSSLECSGFLQANSTEPMGLEFLEYRRIASGVGEMRFVFDTDAEFVVRASRCELRLLMAGA